MGHIRNLIFAGPRGSWIQLFHILDAWIHFAQNLPLNAVQNVPCHSSCLRLCSLQSPARSDSRRVVFTESMAGCSFCEAAAATS